MYEYKAQIVKIIDGDTFDAVVDVGFYITTAHRFRLLNYNAPETRGDEAPMGRIAKAYLEGLILNKEVFLQTEKADVFGRFLADIRNIKFDGVWSMSLPLSAFLIEEGFGVEWNGKGKRPGFDPAAPYPLVRK